MDGQGSKRSGTTQIHEHSDKGREQGQTARGAGLGYFTPQYTATVHISSNRIQLCLAMDQSNVEEIGDVSSRQVDAIHITEN